MKGFEFLELQSQFDGKGTEIPGIDLPTHYVFKKENWYIKETGSIWVPATAKGKLTWNFEIYQIKLNRCIEIKENEKLPTWFQELVHKAEQALEKRDKLRRLFI